MKCLIADDDVVLRTYLGRLVSQWGFEPVLVADGDEAIRVLAAPDPPRVAILDWMMPLHDGLRVARAVRAMADVPYTYLILVTGRVERGDRVAALDAGVDDFVTKPFDAGELQARLGVAQRITGLYQRMEAARRSLEYAASHDPLTGTLNRTGLAACLGGHVAASCARGAPLALLVVDLDHFKSVNDTYGHPGGDVVLREAAERIVRAVRPTDAVGRMGGEEFMVILPGCSAEAAEIVGERVRAAVASRPFHLDDRPLSVTCSVGSASGVGVEATESLTARADAAMYRAKQSGRNRVCAAPPLGRPPGT